jgi:hypothetical protein
MSQKGKPLTFNQKTMCKIRGLNPDNYVLLKNTHAALYLLDLRYNKVKILYKWN